ncbi:MAG TPA: hypothetical protein VE420_15590 [Gemmatimonadales bacterium]|jgi:hypothetical protein|nr:hypothetical protein [Gemmatimonadales bacterium]
MRLICAALIALPATASTSHAQADYYARLGLTGSTKLVRDRLFQEVEVRPGLAPTLVLGAALPFTLTYRAGLEATLTTSGYDAREQDADSDLGTLRTIAMVLGIDGPILGRLGWRGGVGLIRYWPSQEEGIFLQGGSTRLLVGGGIDFRPPVMQKWDLMMSLRYDFHRFTTDELAARRFTGTQGVQRISASIGLARGRR